MSATDNAWASGETGLSLLTLLAIAKSDDGYGYCDVSNTDLVERTGLGEKEIERLVSDLMERFVLARFTLETGGVTPYKGYIVRGKDHFWQVRYHLPPFDGDIVPNKNHWTSPE
jgi:hypothetical protein